MMLALPGVRLKALTAALPATRLEMASLAPLYGETEVKRIADSTGVRAVRMAGTLTTGDLCAAAARHLLAQSGHAAGQIDAVVVVTQTPDQLMPGVAFDLQARLGLDPSCLAFDLNYGCSGYLYGLLQAAMLVRSGCRSVLLCTGDVTTKLVKPGDRHVQMVFGDAASATIVEPGDGAIDFAFSTDGAGRPHLNTPLDYDAGAACSARAGHLHMDGTAVMNFALTQVPVQLLRLMDRCRLGHADVDLAVFHQANAFMLKYLRKLTRFTAEQLPIGMEETGNTGPSSIPLLLAGLPAAPDRRLEQVVLCGFGVGLSVGAARLSLEGTARIAPVDVSEAAMREAA